MLSAVQAGVRGKHLKYIRSTEARYIICGNDFDITFKGLVLLIMYVKIICVLMGHLGSRNVRLQD